MRGWSGRRSTYVYFGVTPQKSNNSIRTTNKKVINLPYIVICLFHKIQWMRNIYSNCMNYYQSARPHSEKSLAYHISPDSLTQPDNFNIYKLFLYLSLLCTECQHVLILGRKMKMTFSTFNASMFPFWR